METTVITKARSRVGEQTKSNTTVSAEVDKVIVGTFAAFAAVIGAWSVACLVSASIFAGGPLQLVSGYFKALSGM